MSNISFNPQLCHSLPRRIAVKLSNKYLYKEPVFGLKAQYNLSANWRKRPELKIGEAKGQYNKRIKINLPVFMLPFRALSGAKIYRTFSFLNL